MSTENAMEIDSDITSCFTEKRWGHEEEGCEVSDGFSFRGKKMFEKAIVGLKDTFTKGFQSKVDGLEFKILDRRKKLLIKVLL